VLAVSGIRTPVPRDLLLVTLTDSQQLLLGNYLITTIFEMKFVYPRQYDGIRRAGLFTKSTIDAFE
jgi:hypothetical protein